MKGGRNTSPSQAAQVGTGQSEEKTRTHTKHYHTCYFIIIVSIYLYRVLGIIDAILKTTAAAQSVQFCAGIRWKAHAHTMYTHLLYACVIALRRYIYSESHPAHPGCATGGSLFLERDKFRGDRL